MIAALALAGIIATSPNDSSNRSLRFVIDSTRRVYDVPVAFAFTTTVWFPSDCKEPAIGDPDAIAVIYNKKQPKNRQYFITPQVDQVGTMTSITFECEQGVRVVLQVNQRPAEESALTVEFTLDSKDDNRVRAAIDEERVRAKREYDQAIREVQKSAAIEAEQKLLRNMIQRFAMSDDVEFARKNFVIAKAFRLIVAGKRGYLLFQVDNRSDNDFVLKSVEVLEHGSNRVLDNSITAIPERRLSPDAIALAAVAFDVPEEAKNFKLVIREDGPRVIEIDDIEL